MGGAAVKKGSLLSKRKRLFAYLVYEYLLYYEDILWFVH